jgi:2-oxoglutarate dehydrogenase E1 component
MAESLQTKPLQTGSLLSSANTAFLEELLERYLNDPDTVDAEWRRFFAEVDEEAGVLARDRRGASWAPRTTRVIGGNGKAAPAPADEPARDAAQARAETLDSIRALMMIRAYRVRGHLIARLDPLGLEGEKAHPELDPQSYGFTDEDLDREIFINYVLGLETATLREILEILRDTYCGAIGVEFMHIQEPDEKAWIQERIEAIRNQTQFTPEGKQAILDKLICTEGLEHFLNKKHTGTKRFGIDGGESLIPALEQVIKRGGQLGVKEIVIGMSHRGRLNVLANVMGKPFAAIFSEFQGGPATPDDVEGSGDVKYHLGTSADREFDNNLVHLSLTANPSHLEAVDPVVIGKVRAKQGQYGDVGRGQVLGVLLHGDAAFAGQGIVAEIFGFSGLRGYRTGGTIHFVVNNQIGFTTAPKYSRSSPYPSDIAKMVQAPIFHVNGDDAEAVVHVARIATEFRQRFKKDVVVDIFCYRRYGHNEADEPAFTQPLMYKAILAHPPVREIYQHKLVGEGLLTEDEGEAQAAAFRQKLEAQFAAAGSYTPSKADWLEGAWSGLTRAPLGPRRGQTGVAVDRLREIGLKLATPPENFDVHRKLLRLFTAKRTATEAGAGIDWASAEALAFATLLADGVPVRLSGQDSGRGTFSHRHAVLVDQQTEERYIPLNHVAEGQAPFEVIDSPLSEASVLGFEYGYSLAEPRALVLWEAQFGDFVNGAQAIIDQFISSGEAKWLRMSGLTLLLPHGFEGQGPEHSSARPERFLQLCAEDNMQVVNCTTPASYFHVLRRQVLREFRKPLIVFTPKSLLRHKLCISRLEDMGERSSFHRVLWDDRMPKSDKDIRRVVLCTGKVYYDLFEEREKRGAHDICILRLEQLYPFPAEALSEELSRFPDAEVVWCQEEPRNMGAWTFVAPRIEEVLGRGEAHNRRPIYIGRREAAAPATGLLRVHQAEQAALVAGALAPELESLAAE